MATDAMQAAGALSGVYQQFLQSSQQNYSNVLSGFSQGINSIGNTLGMGQVLGQNGNWGVATPAANAIAREYARASGQTDQQLISAGLSNSTIRQNMQNANLRQEGEAYGSLGAQLANNFAGYQSQWGLQGLATAEQQAVQDQSLSAQAAAQYMNSYIQMRGQDLQFEEQRRSIQAPQTTVRQNPLNMSAAQYGSGGAMTGGYAGYL